VSGAGSDIGGKSDQFGFVHQPLTGDGAIVARVAALSASPSQGKAGVMIRESLAANARNAFADVTPSRGLAFQRRVKTGGLTSTTAGGSGKAPVWLRVERRGSTFIASRSADGSTWTEIGRESITMAATVYVGLAVTSRTSTAASSAQFEQVAVTGTVVDNQPPHVSLTAPAANQSFTAPATITLSASASDQDGTITRVDFYNGQTLLGSDATAPYSIAWSNVPAGTYWIQAVTIDNGGAMTATNPQAVIVAQAALPTRAVFTPSSNHASGVDYYLLEIFPAGGVAGVTQPVATQGLGKPPVVNGECTADVAQTIIGLWPGSYFATVTAFGTNGAARSEPSNAFSR
jgi:hypothetical protein